MLAGVARKLALPFLVLCGLGWACYVAGFILRNVEYSRDSANVPQQLELEHAAYPEFFFSWVFGVSGPIVLLLAFFHVCAEHQAVGLGASLILPVYLVSAGALLFMNGLQIYLFYRFRGVSVLGDDNIHLYLLDSEQIARADIELYGQDRFIIIEFVGTAASTLFLWIYLLLTPFFAIKGSHYEVY